MFLLAGGGGVFQGPKTHPPPNENLPWAADAEKNPSPPKDETSHILYFLVFSFILFSFIFSCSFRLFIFSFLFVSFLFFVFLLFSVLLFFFRLFYCLFFDFMCLFSFHVFSFRFCSFLFCSVQFGYFLICLYVFLFFYVRFFSFILFSFILCSFLFEPTHPPRPLAAHPSSTRPLACPPIQRPAARITKTSSPPRIASRIVAHSPRIAGAVKCGPVPF